MNDLFHRYDPSMPIVKRYGVLVAELLPGADVLETDDVVRVAWGGGTGIVALVTAEALELRLPTLEWPTPYTPCPTSRLWRRVEWEDIPDRVALTTSLEGASAARRQEFATCRYCGRSFPPERRHSRDVCHGCAERHLGVLH